MKSVVLLIAICLVLVAAQDDRHHQHHHDNDNHIHLPVLCNLICPHGKRCFRSNGHVTCERRYPRCDTHRCAFGQVCELVQVTCSRSPCFPIETCLPIGKTPCSSFFCPQGTVCVATTTGRAICERPF